MSSARGVIAASLIVSRDPDRSGNFVCNGTDDDVEIQAAIDRVAALGGGEVKILSGTYVLSDVLTMDSYVSLVGSGEDVTIIQLSTAVETDMVDIDTKAYVQMRKLTLDMQRNASHTDTLTIAVEAVDSTDLKFESIIIRDAQRYSIRVSGCTRVHILDSKFYDVGNDDNIAIEDESTEVWVINNLVSGHKRWAGPVQSGIEVDDFCERVWIVNNKVIDSPQGIQGHIHDPGDPEKIQRDIYIIDNYVENIDDRAINAVGGGAASDTRIDRYTIIGNHVEDAGGYGINLDNIPNSVISGNMVYNVGHGEVNTEGIRVTGINQYTIVGNTVELVEEIAIYATSATDTVIADNVINDALIGIETRMGAAEDVMRCVVIGNTVNTVATGLYNANAADVAYIGNVVMTTHGVNRACRLESGNDILIVGNDLVSTGAYNIYIEGPQDVQILNNRCPGVVRLVDSDAIRITFQGNWLGRIEFATEACSYVYILGNLFNGSAMIYFRVTGVSHVYIKNNVFQHLAVSDQWGIRLDDVALDNIEITGNTFISTGDTWQRAIQLRGGDVWTIQRNQFIGYVGANSSILSISTLPTNLTLESRIYPFQQGGDEASGIVAGNFIHATASPKGWEIDAGTEWAIALGQLPPEVQQIVYFKIWAVALAAAGNPEDMMMLEININAGQGNEAYTAEAIAVANKPSDDQGFAINDVISWSLTVDDDEDLDDIVGGESVEIKVFHEAAAGVTLATDAAFRAVEVQYI